ncbi:VOC family protein [Phyllobacterium salinisoli]|uniref:VOC family protein n=1 Tax=Phyllobacterium salinisoli TaxID=1899321 RepID=A0A368K1I5_9HYPH|nr:VOC family protein [Phyllobacterium salinisoli]RCS23256.1 VOC family protein [Phyllobacterium salinisoli]
MPKQSNFIWYELMTSDLAGAEAFYKEVIGWNAENWPGEMPYTIVKAGETGVAGLMTIPEEAKAMGARPMWLAYIHAEDVDAATESLRKAGGKVYREPADIPEVGRFSVVADPQGAMFMLMAPSMEGPPPLPESTPGTVGWNELYAGDGPSAFDFYSSQFGWTKDQAMDMGPMGVYQLFAIDGQMRGAVMTKPENVPVPMWQFYFNVDGLDAALDRVKENRGKVVMDPMEVPGGSWVAGCVDPQGALFSLVSPKR